MIRTLKKIDKVLDKKQKTKLIVLLFFMIIGAGFEAVGVSLIIPYITSLMTFKPDTKITIALIVIFVVKNVYIYLLKCKQSDFIVKNCCETSVRLFRAYLNKPYEFFLHSNSNNIVTTINIYVTKAFVLIGEILNLAAEIAVITALFGYLLFINFKIAIIIVVLLALLSFLIKCAINPKLRDIGQKSNDTYNEMIKCVSQAINGIKEVKMFGKEDFFAQVYEELSERNTYLENKKHLYSFMPRHLIEVMAIGTMLIMVLISSSSGNVDLSTVISQAALFSFVLIRLLPGTIKINNSINMIAYYAPSLMLIDDEISVYLKNEYKDEEKDAELWKLENMIKVDNVSFSYNKSNDKLVLNELNLSIVKGECIGIMGESGIGKTTLLDVILGYLEPCQGRVLVDGKDIGENIRGWRKNIGYVPQMIFLLDDSIKSNILFGNRYDGDERLWKVLKLVRLDEFVSSLPNGLDTQIGERGIRLSGGQRQRLGLARALYNDPEILVFDEATAALDNKLEEEVMDDIYSLSDKKTMIIVAHRLSTLKKCDRIYEINDGQAFLT